MNMSCKKLVLVPYFINLTEKWNNAGHKKTALYITVILLKILFNNNILQPFKTNNWMGGVCGQTCINLT